MRRPKILVKGGKIIRSESLEQAQWAGWFRQQYPNIPFTCSLAGLSNKVITRAAKMGYEPGTPDIILFAPKVLSSDEFYDEEYGQEVKAHGLCLEFKRLDRRTEKNGGVSEAQAIYHKKLLDQGYQVNVVYGFDEAKQVTESYLKGATNEQM